MVDMSADLKHKRQALNLRSMMLFCMIRVKLQTKRVRCYLIGINLGRIEIIVKVWICFQHGQYILVITPPVIHKRLSKIAQNNDDCDDNNNEVFSINKFVNGWAILTSQQARTSYVS